jgi:hypothetical protein
MVPAKITNLNPVQVTYYKLLKPHANLVYYDVSIYLEEKERHLASKVIADVENVEMAPLQITKIPIWTYTNEICTTRLDLNDSCFIEPTTEGKCKIMNL